MSRDAFLHEVLYPALFIIVAYVAMRATGMIGKSKKK